MEQKEAKAKIAQLVENYERILKAGKVKSYTEEETKKEFILPLFKALGWNVDSKEEVSAEEHVKSSGLADYGFYINGRAKFYLEAKSLKADLYKEEFARQAIRYSFNKVVTWAVLTDFENIKVFNANAISEHLGDKQYFDIAYTEYLERFDQLWLLSREAFEQDLIDVEATKAGKLLKKVSVTDKLYEDLNKCRELLTNSLVQWNPEVPRDLLDEGVQKLLDRLIFIRVAEDRKVEPPTLTALIREWYTPAGKQIPLYQSMVKKFRELDDIYNSNLFSQHPFEKWEEYGETEKVINILYGKEGYYEYDFKYIPADVLGNIYEHYLGYQLAKSAKGTTTSKDAKKRKEQGIYYTPTYIVDYIVTNALQPILDKCESIAELKQIKVLDPACGSGSFLLKATEVIAAKYEEFGRANDELTKIQILTENIYGVDLDEQAVEIARLNLLINSLDTRMKLPNLAKNIKNGNSLISGTDAELEKAFGKNYRDKKPFNWKEEFPEVFNRENPGFDVVIGNPPYVQLSMEEKTDEDLKNYLLRRYGTSMGRLNTFGFFIALGIELVREDGYEGFIIPNTLLMQDYYEKLRTKILDTTRIRSIAGFELLPFKDATVENVVTILQKNTSSNQTKEQVLIYQSVSTSFIKTKDIAQQLFHETSKHTFNIGEGENPLVKKVKDNTKPLSFYLNVNQAIALRGSRSSWIAEEKINDSYVPVLLGGRNINRYSLNWNSYFLNYTVEAIHSGGDTKKFLAKEKILFRRVADQLIGTLDKDQLYALHTLVVMTLREGCKININYFLALFNSRLFTYYYRSSFASGKKVFSEIGATQVRELPIKAPEPSIEISFERLVNKMLELNADLKNAEENSDKWYSIKSELEKADNQIDQLVYKLYGLSASEISLIEGGNSI